MVAGEANNQSVASSKRAVRYAKAHPHPKRRPIHYNHHRHTGKKLPFHQTSYALIFFVILFTMGCLLFVRTAVVSGLTESGSVQLSGLVPGPPPSIAAVIEEPIEGQRFTTNTVTVTGTCENDYIVELYRNGDLAGSVVCEPTDTFSIMITLVAGSNDLVARTRDIINQYGPDSSVVQIFYDVPVPPEDDEEPAENDDDSPPVTPPVKGGGIVVSSKGYFRVDQETKTVRLTFSIKDGVAPYSVVVRWGDGQQSKQVFTRAGTHTLKHTYKQSGQYRVVIEVTDANGARAVFQTVVIVDGVTSVNLTTGETLTQRCQLDAVCIFQNQIVDAVNRVWPVFIMVSIMTLCFWFGERVAIHMLVKKSTH